MRIAVFCLLFFGFGTYAEESHMDQKLRRFIRDFALEPLPPPLPQDRDVVLLGRELFFDKDMSGNRNISCSDCHHPFHGTGDDLPLPIGEGGVGLGPFRQQETGKIILRNAPALFNLGYSDITFMFWDGRVSFDPVLDSFTTPEPGLNGQNPPWRHITKNFTGALSAQTIFPLTSHNEMRGQDNDLADAPDNFTVWQRILVRLFSKDKYKTLFLRAWPEVSDFNIGHVARAMGAFITWEFQAINTPFDRYLRGDDSALSFREKKGLQVFLTRGKCADCHTGRHLSNFTFKSVGVPQITPETAQNFDDLGRSAVSMNKRDQYKFKTPSLRNVALSAPYMHNGSLRNLREVIEHYNSSLAALDGYQVSSDIQQHYDEAILVDKDPVRNKLRHLLISTGEIRRGLGLTAQEKDDLLLFMEKSLTDIGFLERFNDISL